MEYPGGTPKRLTNSRFGEFEPAWSPDGQYIAFTTWADTDRLSRTRAQRRCGPAAATHAAGRLLDAVRPTRSTADASSPPAARRARFRTGSGGRGGGAKELVWIPAAGGEATFIASGGGRRRISAGATRRASSRYNGGRGLYSMRWDGTDIKSILRFARQRPPGGGGGGGAGAQRASAQISPDGQRVLAQVNLDLYYIPDIPWPGGAEPTITVGGTGPSQDFPSKKLTDIGAQFPAWATDSKRIHWTIGNAHAVYDVDRARTRSTIPCARRTRRARSVPARGAGGDSAAAPGAGRGAAARARSTSRWSRASASRRA